MLTCSLQNRIRGLEGTTFSSPDLKVKENHHTRRSLFKQVLAHQRIFNLSRAEATKAYQQAYQEPRLAVDLDAENQD